MAELNVQPKKSSPIWWIILIIIIILIVLYFVFGKGYFTNGNIHTGKDSTGMIRVNNAQTNKVARYQGQMVNQPAQYS